MQSSSSFYRYALENESRSPTEPKTPTDGDNDIDHNGDFARLIPEGRLARLAFSQIVDDSHNIPSWNSHARRFIHVGPRVPLRGASTGPTSSSSDFEGPSQPPEMIWTGWFRLNMGIPPDNASLGWIVGSGRANRVADFLICRPKSYNVSGRHARFLHHKHTGQFLVHSDGRKVLLEGKEEVMNSKRTFTKPITGISFGDLTYTMVFTDLSEEVYRHQIMTSSSPPSFLTPTPSVTDLDVQNYSIKSMIAKGSTCVVSLAIDRRTGDAVAIKRMHRDSRNEAKIREEEKVLRSLKPHSKICQLVDVIHVGERARDHGPLDEVYLVFLPVARNHLGHFVSSDLSDADRVSIFHQCIDGLAHIHQQGLMHRDIKPGNIGVVSIQPAIIIILDFGVATYALESREHTAGTISYLAPEVLALKHGTSVTAYTKAADVWSLGVTIYQLLSRSMELWRQIDRDNYVRVCVRLGEFSFGHEFEAAVDLVGEMVKWSPRARITAQDALLDKAFSFMKVVPPDQIADDDSTLKRSWKK